MRREWSNLNFFSNTILFGHILKKSTNSLFGAWWFLLVHIRFTPNEKPKDFVNWLFKKSDHGSWTINLDHEKWPSPMVRLHGPWCRPILSYNNGSDIGQWSSLFENLGSLSFSLSLRLSPTLILMIVEGLTQRENDYEMLSKRLAMPFAEGNVTCKFLVTRNSSGLLFVILVGKFFTSFEKWLCMFSTGMYITSVEEAKEAVDLDGNVGRCLSHCVIDIDSDYIRFLNMFFSSLLPSRFILN